MGPKKNPSKPPPPHLNRQQPPQPPHLNRQQQQPPRPPVKIYHELPPKIIHTDVANFKALVQRLTGRRTPSPPSTPSSPFDSPRDDSLSPASKLAATENANRAVQRPTKPLGILSPGPNYSPPLITPDFFLPAAPNNALAQFPQPQQDFLYPSAFIEEELWNHQNQHHEPPISSIYDDGAPPKRPRFDFGGGDDTHNYLSQDNDLYYLQNMQTLSDGVGTGGNNMMMMPPIEHSGLSPLDCMPLEEDNMFNDGVGMGSNNTMMMMMMQPTSSMSMCDLMSGNIGLMPPFEEVDGIGGNNAMTWPSGQQDLTGTSKPSGVMMPQDMSMGGSNNVMMPPSSSMPMSMDELMIWHNSHQDSINRPRRRLFPLPQGPFTNTLFVEGFPSDCSEREVAHIFRHFYGFREVRLVTNFLIQTNVDPPVVCFAEFESPESAACAFAALQGYKMDVNEHDSKFLQIQFFQMMMS